MQPETWTCPDCGNVYAHKPNDHACQRLPQRVRAQDERTVAEPAGRAPRRTPCRARIELPDRMGGGTMLFFCNRPSHDDDPELHIETGRVRAKDGKVRIYHLEWWEAGEHEVWRG